MKTQTAKTAKTFRRAAPADFLLQSHGTLCLLIPVSDMAKTWAEENIGMNNGYQPYWPTVVIELRYVNAILEGIQADGLGIR